MDRCVCVREHGTTAHVYIGERKRIFFSSKFMHIPLTAPDIISQRDSHAAKHYLTATRKPLQVCKGDNIAVPNAICDYFFVIITMNAFAWQYDHSKRFIRWMYTKLMVAKLFYDEVMLNRVEQKERQPISVFFLLLWSSSSHRFTQLHMKLPKHKMSCVESSWVVHVVLS